MRILPALNWLCALAVLALLSLASTSSPVLSQGVGSLLPSESTSDQDAETERIDRILRSAAEHGVGVVVIGSDGEVVAQSGGAPARDDAARTQPETTPLMEVQDKVVAFRSALIERLLNLPDAFNEVAFILRASSPDGTITAFVLALVWSLALFAVGIFAEMRIFGPRIAKRFVVSRVRENPEGYAEKMPFLVFRFFWGVLGALFSMAVAYVLGYLIFGPLQDTAMQFTVALINAGYLMARIVIGVWRMILSPFLSQYRIPHLTDRDARRLYRWLSAVASLGFFALLFSVWIQELGLNYEVYAFLSSLLSFFIVILNIVMLTVNRRAITGAILNGVERAEASWLVRLLSSVWLPAVIVFFIFGWADHLFELVVGEETGVPLVPAAYGILTVIIVVYGLANFLIERGFARARAMRAMNAVAAEPADEVGDLAEIEEEHQFVDVPRGPAITTFEGLARRVAGIVAFTAGAYAFVAIWDPRENMMEQSLFQQLLDIVVICFLGYIAYTAFRIWIDGKIAEEAADAPEAELGDEGGASAGSRLATLLPLFRNVVLIVIAVSVVLIALMEMGVNVGPLFAGAGIVGVAVGFGSQSLVRDIFSGAFFLFDDAFRKGEYLDVGGVKGTVEKISVRSFQLRHHLGTLHTIPFGEIQVMSNFSRDWVIMKLPLRVTYDTDVEKVRKLIKKLGQALLEDPTIGPQFIQPLKSQGVIEMQDSAMIIRVKFMTKPGDQWLIRKRVFQEIRDLFEREGIKFAHREVTVRLADGKVDELTPDQREAATAAARSAFEEEFLEEGEMDGGDDR